MAHQLHIHWNNDHAPTTRIRTYLRIPVVELSEQVPRDHNRLGVVLHLLLEVLRTDPELLRQR